jgi:hypothetical protein
VQVLREKEWGRKVHSGLERGEEKRRKRMCGTTREGRAGEVRDSGYGGGRWCKNGGHKGR